MDPNSRAVFFAKGQSAIGTFDDYGALSGNFSSSMTLTSILETTDISGTMDATGCGLLEQPSKGYNDAMLIIPERPNTEYHKEITCVSGHNWGTVSNTSHITTSLNNDVNMSLGDFETIGIAFNTDSGGTHCVGRSILRVQSQSNGGQYQHGCITLTDDGQGITRNRTDFNNTNGQRFMTAASSCDNSWALLSKDQQGTNSSSGQPTMLCIKEIGDSGTNPTSGTSTSRFFYDNNFGNTHGNLMRGQFFGGRLNGTTRENWYLVCYNQYSSGSDGRQIVRIDVADDGTKSQGFEGNYDSGISVSAGGGFNIASNSIYPHGLVHMQNGATVADDSSNTRYIYYVDLSSVSATTDPIRINGSNQHYFGISQIGIQTGDPVYAYVESNTLKIARFDVSTETMQSPYATLSVTNGDTCIGIWPVPDTNRLLLAIQGGVKVVELN